MHNEDVTPITLSSNYSGAFEHVSLTNGDLLKLTNSDANIIHGPTLFALKYRVLPCTLDRDSDMTLHVFSDIHMFSEEIERSGKQKQEAMYHATSVIRFLVNQYKVDPNTFLYNRKYNTSEKHSVNSKVYIDLGNYLSVLFEGGCKSPPDIDNPNTLEPDQDSKIFHCFLSVEVFHVPQTEERAQTLLQQLSKFQLFPVTVATLKLVCHHADRGFYTSAIRMKKPHITDLKLHYGDEFPDIHKELLETLKEKDSTGITFLHGPPGTGKTHYLRYLINEIQDKRLIYVPPDLVKEIAQPGFLPFLMRHQNSILIIEDAENIIMDRKQETFLSKQSVSNLLNLSDGLLGDAMHQQIICTFNCDVQGIDPALLREGRLVIEHKFDKLSAANARRLCVELNIPGNGEDIHEPVTLAEIYARKNAAAEASTNGHDDGNTTTKNKRPLKKRKQGPDSFFGIYS